MSRAISKSPPSERRNHPSQFQRVRAGWLDAGSAQSSSTSARVSAPSAARLAVRAVAAASWWSSKVESTRPPCLKVALLAPLPLPQAGGGHAGLSRCSVLAGGLHRRCAPRFRRAWSSPPACGRGWGVGQSRDLSGARPHRPARRAISSAITTAPPCGSCRTSALAKRSTR